MTLAETRKTAQPSVTLVPLAECHLETHYRWMTDDRIRQMLLFEREITREDHRRWFEGVVQDAGERVYAGLVEQLDGGAALHFGSFGYRQLSARHRSGDLWMLVGPEYWGRSLGRALLAVGLGAGRAELGLRKIVAHVRTDNVRAAALYADAGFRVEGVLRAEQLFCGQPVDLLRMAVIANSSND